MKNRKLRTWLFAALVMFAAMFAADTNEVQADDIRFSRMITVMEGLSHRLGALERRMSAFEGGGGYSPTSYRRAAYEPSPYRNQYPVRYVDYSPSHQSHGGYSCPRCGFAFGH